MEVMKLNPLVLDAIEKRAQRAGRLKGGTYFEAQAVREWLERVGMSPVLSAA